MCEGVCVRVCVCEGVCERVCVRGCGGQNMLRVFGFAFSFSRVESRRVYDTNNLVREAANC